MEDRRGLYAFLGILLGFKIWTLIIILWLTSSWQTIIFLLAGHVLWFSVAGVLLVGPAAFWARLIRMRRKRKELQHAEWNVEEPQGTFWSDNRSDD